MWKEKSNYSAETSNKICHFLFPLTSFPKTLFFIDHRIVCQNIPISITGICVHTNTQSQMGSRDPFTSFRITVLAAEERERGIFILHAIKLKWKHSMDKEITSMYLGHFQVFLHLQSIPYSSLSQRCSCPPSLLPYNIGG